MKNVLLVTSSPRGAESLSTIVAEKLVQALRTATPTLAVTSRNLAIDPVPHIDEDFVTVTRRGVEASNDPQRAFLARSAKLIEEVKSADTIVIAASMINFTIPSTLKAWIDHVFIPGQAFSYSATGVEGLFGGRRAVLVLARGGVYSEGPFAPFDFQLPYLKAALNFVGITDIRTIVIEGVAYGPEAAQAATDAALAKAEVIAAELAA